MLLSLLATTSADSSIKIWNTADWSLRQTLTAESQRWVWDAQFSADSNYIVTGKCTNITTTSTLSPVSVVMLQLGLKRSRFYP